MKEKWFQLPLLGYVQRVGFYAFLIHSSTLSEVVLIEEDFTVWRTANGLGESLSVLLDIYLGESLGESCFLFLLTNECWKLFSENYEESWHFPLASFVYKKVKRNVKACWANRTFGVLFGSLVSQSSPRLSHPCMVSPTTLSSSGSRV